MNNRAEEEKKREFCYEVAMALRRIADKIVKNANTGFAAVAGEESAPPDGTVDSEIAAAEDPENRA